MNCILLRKGVDKIFIHNYHPQPKLPLILSNYQESINIASKKPFLSETLHCSSDNRYLNNNLSNKLNFTNLGFQIRPIFNETTRNEEFSFDINCNPYQNNSNKNTKNIGISVNIKDFSPNKKNLNKLSYNNSADTSQSLIFINDIDSELNNKANNINFINYKNNIFLNPNLQTFKTDDSMSNSTNESYLRMKKIIKNKKELKDKIKQLTDKKKIYFMKNKLKNNRNFLIADYLKNKILIKNSKYMPFKNEERCTFLNNKNENKKKQGQPILIKDIRIKSLLNDYDNKKKKLIKLSPFILRENYINNYGKNKRAEIKDYELKMNIKNNYKYHFRLVNLGNIFDLTKTNSK